MKILIVLICLLVFTPTVGAVEGYISLEYNLLGETARNEQKRAIATLELWQTFGDYFAVGGILQGELAGIGFTRVIPGGIPIRQYYAGYLKFFPVEQFEIKISSWCWHWLSQSGVSGFFDSQGLTIGVKYRF